VPFAPCHHEAAGASVVASSVLAGGALTGKYGRREEAGAVGRLAGERDEPGRQEAFRVGERLRQLADDMGTTPAELAIAFALSNPRVASVLFGATTPEQIADNIGALDLLARMSDGELAELRSLRPVEG